MHVWVTIHTVAAVVAIACGIFILVLRKGTQRHRMLGRIYVVSILVMVILSFFIRQIRIDQFSIFHLISIQVTVFVAVGLGQSFFDPVSVPGMYGTRGSCSTHTSH